MINYRLLFL